MGADALEGNGITRKILYFFRDKALTPADEPLRRVRKSRILLFVIVQLAGFGATMAVTQTIGASPALLTTLTRSVCSGPSCYRFPCDHPAAGAHQDAADSSITVHRGGARRARWSDRVCFRRFSPKMLAAPNADRLSCLQTMESVGGSRVKDG